MSIKDVVAAITKGFNTNKPEYKEPIVEDQKSKIWNQKAYYLEYYRTLKEGIKRSNLTPTKQAQFIKDRFNESGVDLDEILKYESFISNKNKAEYKEHKFPRGKNPPNRNDNTTHILVDDLARTKKEKERPDVWLYELSDPVHQATKEDMDKARKIYKAPIETSAKVYDSVEDAKEDKEDKEKYNPTEKEKHNAWLNNRIVEKSFNLYKSHKELNKEKPEYKTITERDTMKYKVPTYKMLLAIIKDRDRSCMFMDDERLFHKIDPWNRPTKQLLTIAEYIKSGYPLGQVLNYVDNK